MVIQKIVLFFCCMVTSSVYRASSAFGETLVAQPVPYIQLKFPYNLLNTDFVYTATVGTATVSTTGTNFAQIQAPSSIIASTAVLASKYRLNYQPGKGCTCLFTAIFNNNGATGGVVGSRQIIGVGNFSTNTSPNFSNIQDGFFFGYNAVTFGIFQYVNGLVSFTAQTSWNVDKMDGTGPSGMTLIQNNGNVYKIQYCWLGFGHVNFYIENPKTSTLTLVHVIKYGNANTVTSLLNPSLQLMAGVSKEALILTSITLKTPCMVGMVDGYINSDFASIHSIYSNVSGTAINTTLTEILSIKNNLTFNGAVNQVMVYLDSMSFQTSSLTAGGGNVIFTLYLNPTVRGNPTFTNINAATSVVSYSTNGTTITSPPGKLLAVFFGNATNSNDMFIDLTDYNIVLAPGDQLVVAAQTVAGTSTVFTSFNWRERF